MRWLGVALLIGITLRFPAAAQDAGALSRRAQAVAEVWALERQIEAALVKGDVEFLQSAWADDFQCTHGDSWTSGGHRRCTTNTETLARTTTRRRVAFLLAVVLHQCPYAWSPAAMRCRRKFLRHFPGGFSDDTYVDWERAYKWNHRHWREELSPTSFAHLIPRRRALRRSDSGGTCGRPGQRVFRAKSHPSRSRAESG